MLLIILSITNIFYVTPRHFYKEFITDGYYWLGRIFKGRWLDWTVIYIKKIIIHTRLGKSDKSKILTIGLSVCIIEMS